MTAELERIISRLERQISADKPYYTHAEFWRMYGYAVQKLPLEGQDAAMLLADLERLAGNTAGTMKYLTYALTKDPKNLVVIDRLLASPGIDDEMHLFYRILRLAKQDPSSSQPFDAHLREYESVLDSPFISLVYRCCMSTSNVEDIGRFLARYFDCDMSFQYVIILIYQINAGFMQYRLDKLLHLIGFLCLVGEKILSESVDNVSGYFAASVIAFWIQDNVEILRAVSVSVQYSSQLLKPCFDRVFAEILKNALRERHLKISKYSHLTQEFLAVISGMRSLNRLYKLIMSNEVDSEQLLNEMIQKARSKLRLLSQATIVEKSNNSNTQGHSSKREALIFSSLLPHKKCTMICDFDFSLANVDAIRNILRNGTSGLIIPCNFVDRLDETKKERRESRELSRIIDEFDGLVLLQKGSCISASGLLKSLPSFKKFDFSQSDLEWLSCILYYKDIITKAGNECQLQCYTLNSNAVKFLRDAFNINAFGFLS